MRIFGSIQREYRRASAAGDLDRLLKVEVPHGRIFLFIAIPDWKLPSPGTAGQ
jgi:hypothetical protein